MAISFYQIEPERMGLNLKKGKLEKPKQIAMVLLRPTWVACELYRTMEIVPFFPFEYVAIVNNI